MSRAVQRAFSAGIVAPTLWARTDYEKWTQALKDAENVVPIAQGAAQSRGGTRLASGYDTSTVDGYQFLIPFEASEDDTYMLEFGDAVMRVLKSGSYVLNSAVAAGAVDAVTAANPAQIQMDSSATAATFTVGTLVFFEDPNGSSVLHNAVLEITAIASDLITFKIVGGVTIDTTTGDWGTLGSGATISEIYEVVSPFAIEHLPFTQFTQDVDTMFFSNRGYDPYKLVRADDDDWTFSTVTIAPETSAPTGESATNSTGSGSTTYNYKVSAVNAETGEESLPSSVASCTNDLTTAGNQNTVSWSSVSGAQYYRVYKEFNGIYGYIGITEGTSFIDENITPDTATNPQSARDPFSGSLDKPGVVSFIGQRLSYAATVNNPQLVEMSTSISPLNFSRALTPGESDAVTFRMRSQKLNKVMHMIEAVKPLILTSGAEWYIETVDDAGISTGNFALRPRSYRGSAAFPMPVTAGTSLLHVTRDGNTVRSIELEDVTLNRSRDVTLLCRHLFRGKQITSMAFAQAPDMLVWVTLDDGSCYSMSYLPDEGIYGWTKHVFGGTDSFVRQVAVVTEGAVDRPYFVVSRTIDGQTITLVEYLDDRVFTDVTDCYFVDCGLSYSGSAASSFRGLLHLRGEAVSVLGDGNVLDGLTVSDTGVLATPSAVENLAVGLGYDAYIVTLDADFGSVDGVGATMGRFVAAGEVAIKCEDTRGIAVGREGGTLSEVKEFTGVEPIPLFTGTYIVDIDGDWERDQAIEVRQVYPLPMTITAVGPDWEIER